MIIVTLSKMRRFCRRIDNLARMTGTRAETWCVAIEGDTATAIGESGAEVLISQLQSIGDSPALPCPCDLLDKDGLTWSPRRQEAYQAAANGATRALDLLLTRDAIELAKAKEREARRVRRPRGEE